MNTVQTCKQCNNTLKLNDEFCSKCGLKTISFNEKSSSNKSGKIALLLCITLGVLGAHRFYVGKKWTALFMLFTGGGLGIFVFIDLILIIKNNFEDKQGNCLILTQNMKPTETILVAIGSVLSFFIICIAYGGFILMYAASTLDTTADFQLIALRHNQIDKAYSYTSKEFQKIISIQNFKQYIDAYPILKNNTSASFNERNIFKNHGYLSGTLTAKDGTQIPIEYQFIKENGVWKILNFKIK